MTITAKSRTTILPGAAVDRKQFPVASGFMDYFPDAIVAVSNLSYIGNNQHHPGQPLHWDRAKSTDEADTMLRHFLQRGTLDSDGVRHSVKMAWRALALLQKEIENEQSERPTWLYPKPVPEPTYTENDPIRPWADKITDVRVVGSYGISPHSRSLDRTRMENPAPRRESLSGDECGCSACVQRVPQTNSMDDESNWLGEW